MEPEGHDHRRQPDEREKQHVSAVSRPADRAREDDAQDGTGQKRPTLRRDRECRACAEVASWGAHAGSRTER
jgi:hypothetical protein